MRRDARNTTLSAVSRGNVSSLLMLLIVSSSSSGRLSTPIEKHFSCVHVQVKDNAQHLVIAGVHGKARDCSRALERSLLQRLVATAEEEQAKAAKCRKGTNRGLRNRLDCEIVQQHIAELPIRGGVFGVLIPRSHETKLN